MKNNYMLRKYWWVLIIGMLVHTLYSNIMFRFLDKVLTDRFFMLSVFLIVNFTGLFLLAYLLAIVANKLENRREDD